LPGLLARMRDRKSDSVFSLIIRKMLIPARLQKALESLLGSPGETDPALRRALLQRARTGTGEAPEPLLAFADKIAGQPWTVTDEDFLRLRAAGYSEDQIFEVVLAAALGAGLQRFDAGLRALKNAGADAEAL
jgi:alkylhydroperoxidase family enzyme